MQGIWLASMARRSCSERPEPAGQKELKNRNLPKPPRCIEMHERFAPGMSRLNYREWVKISMTMGVEFSTPIVRGAA
ncbi:MAG TPA: hypothetical protein DDY20_06495 [Desulfobulbaceae bacterium]|nr:hypothetical protein [Desulfobulbaceae bacterium]